MNVASAPQPPSAEDITPAPQPDPADGVSAKSLSFTDIGPVQVKLTWGFGDMVMHARQQSSGGKGTGQKYEDIIQKTTRYQADRTGQKYEDIIQKTTRYQADNECIATFKENFTQDANNTSTLVKQQLPITTPASTEENENRDFDTLMLIWTWPFGFTFEAESCSSQFGIKGCQFTTDRSQYDKAHGVVFHHRDIGGDLANLQTTSRPSHQKWVWINMESPDNSPRWSGIDGLFNLTSTYLRDSDVWVPYGRIVKASEENKTFEIPPKDKLVCWIVSNWNPNFRRVKYYNELSKHIKVEVYGSAFNRYLNDADYNATMSSCKFYLSFESSSHKDYFTEKLFNAMKLNVVPVVLGPSRENYEEFIPPDSFIHVDDFESPEKLAEHLTFLDQNQEKYEQYFNWRKLFFAESTFFGLEHACRSCDHIRKHDNYRVFKSITKWYWD
ncbi:4-galactosyl-N-acetylglucosaminide 3-alpha-L-fucosyltransferase 9-like [Clarias gariepinus]